MKYVLFVLVFCLLFFTCSRSKPDAKAETEPKGPVLVEMKTEAQKHVGLTLQAVSRSQLSEYLQVTGSVQPIDSKVTQVHSLSRGRVTEVLAKIGDRVQKDQPLVRIDNIEAGELFSEAESAKAELQKLKVQATNQNKQFERTRRLVEIGAAAQKDLELAQAEKEQLAQSIRAQEGVIAGISSKLRRSGMEDSSERDSTTVTLRAPFYGVITKTHAANGELVESGAELFSVADLSQVWVQAEVYEKDLGRIRMGQPAFVTVDTYPDEKFTAKVSYISDVLDPQTRTAKVRCEMSNPGLRLKLDMFASVQVPTTFSKEAIAVPVSAMQQVEGSNVVFVRKDETHFEMRPVKAGKTVKGQLEIVSGLEVGEEVVTQGAFHLKSILAGKELGGE